MRRFIIVLPVFFFLFLTAVAPRAEEPLAYELPPEIHGIWTHPDCDGAMATFLFTGRFAMQADKGSHPITRLTRIAPAEKEGAWTITVAGQDDAPVAVRALDESTLLYSIRFFVPGYVDEKPRAEPDNPMAIRLARCAKPHAGIVMDEDWMDAFRALDRIDRACMAAGLADPVCRKTVFDAADADLGGGLDAEELAAFWRHFAFAAGARGTCAPGSDAALAPTPDAAAAAAFAAEMLAVADADRDAALSFEEIMIFGPVLAVRGHGARLRDALPALATFLPWIGAQTPGP